MRCLIFILFLLTTTRLIAANAIDSLQTDTEVEVFANKVIGKYHGAKNLAAQIIPSADIYNNTKCDSVAKRWNSHNWQKADFNGDGKTDLLIILYLDRRFRSYVITDAVSQGFKTHNLNRNHFADCELAKIITINGQPALLYYYIKGERSGLYFDYPGRLKTDTLIYKHGGFVEYNRNAQPVKIKAISLETYGSWEQSDAFKLSIQRNGDAVYKPTSYGIKSTTVTGKLTAQTFDEITNLLSYINIRELKDEYAVAWTDDQTVNLKITFADGSTKSIHDYGLKSSFGLSHLYKLLFDLRTSQAWK